MSNRIPNNFSITSEHFSHDELRCPHCGVNLCTRLLLMALEQLRGTVGRPVIVTSAYRCTAHNRAVGGALNSKHILGEAADVRVKGVTGAQLETAALACELITAIGRSDTANYIHIDVRKVAPVRWCYDAAGREIAYFPASVEKTIAV